MDEDKEMSTDEMLDKLCWMQAISGERSYPPGEVAQEELDGRNYENDPDDSMFEQAYWTTAEKWLIARDMFDDLEKHGFDPKKRAERYLEQAREDGDDLDDIDWTWLLEEEE